MAYNAGMQRVTGRDHTGLDSGDLRETLTALFGPEAGSTIVTHLESGQPLRNHQAELQRPSGLPYRASISSMQVNFGQGQAHLLAVDEITSRAMALDTLRESEARYRDLYDNAPQAYFSVSPQGQYCAATARPRR